MSAFSSSSSASDVTMHGEFMAFVMDGGSQEVMREWAARQGFPLATVQLAGNAGAPDLFAQLLEASAPPKMAVIDIDGQIDPTGAIVRLASLCGPDCKLIAIGSANDVTLYRQMITGGAIDYIVKPLAPEMLNQALAVALRGGSGGKPAVREARNIVLIGARGGVGASTIAINLGWLMAHELGQQTALLDLDLQFGTSSLALDLEPGRGMRDIVSSPHRVDALMIASSMVAQSDNFSVLGAEEAIDELVPIDGAAIAALLKEVKSNFDVTLIDLPRHQFAMHKRLLATAQDIVLVTELSLAGIRDTLRLKSALKNLDSMAVLTVVASRVGPNKSGQVDASAFEKGAQIKIDFMIPEDHKAAATAANGGKALAAVARKSPAAVALHSLAVKLVGTNAGNKKTVSLADKFKSKFSGKPKKKGNA